MLVGAGSSEGRTAQPPSCISVTQARDEEEGSCSHDSSGLPSNDGGAAECKSRTNGISWCCDGDSIHRIAAQDDMHRLSWRRSYRSSMAISTALCVAASLSNVVDAAFILPSGPFTGAALVFGITVACAVVIEFELVRSYVSQEPLGPVGVMRASMLCNLLASVLGTASGVLPAACRERASLPDILASCDDVQFNLFDSASALTGIAVALLASHGVCLPTFAAIRAVIIFSALLLGLRLALSHGETHVQSIASTIIFTIVAGVCVRLGYDRDLNARCLQHRRNATLRKQLARESEAAQQAAATAYSATIGFMMHDLRTPLQGIASSLYFVQSSREVAAVPRSSAFHSDLKQIGLCVSRITSLCNDVLDLSTVGETAPSSGPGASRGAPIHPTLCSPRDIVRDVINQVSRATPVPIVTHIAGSVPARALTDGSRLRRIILVALASAVRVARSRTTVVVLIYSAPPEELAADDENSVVGAADGERMTARSRELLQPQRAHSRRVP